MEIGSMQAQGRPERTRRLSTNPFMTLLVEQVVEVVLRISCGDLAWECQRLASSRRANPG
jgi:hypothetical protein